MAPPPAFLQAAARTPFAPLGGALRRLPAVELAAQAVRGFLEGPGMPAARPGALILAQAVSAGCGPDPARAVALASGLPETRAFNVRAGSGLGLEALFQAEALIRAGAVDSALVVGVESASGAPYLLPGARWGTRFGEVELLDTLLSESPRPGAPSPAPTLAADFPPPSLPLRVSGGQGTSRWIEADEDGAPPEGGRPAPGDGAAVALLVRHPGPGALARFRNAAWIPPGPAFRNRLEAAFAALASEPIPWIASPGLPQDSPRWAPRPIGVPEPWGAEGIRALLTLLAHLERRGGLALGTPEEGVHLLLLESCPC